jgi:hypothetical protein
MIGTAARIDYQVGKEDLSPLLSKDSARSQRGQILLPNLGNLLQLVVRSRLAEAEMSKLQIPTS